VNRPGTTRGKLAQRFRERRETKRAAVAMLEGGKRKEGMKSGKESKPTPGKQRKKKKIREDGAAEKTSRKKRKMGKKVNS